MVSPTRTPVTKNQRPAQMTGVSTQIQWLPVQLAHQHVYDIHVAINDKNRTYEGEPLRVSCLDELVLQGFSDAVTKISCMST